MYITGALASKPMKKRKEWEKEKELFQEKRFGLGELALTGLSCDPISCHIIHKQEIPSDHLRRSRNHAWSFCVSSMHFFTFLQGGSRNIEKYCWYWLLSQQIRRTQKEERSKTKAQWRTYKNSEIIREMTIDVFSLRIFKCTDVALSKCPWRLK